MADSRLLPEHPVQTSQPVQRLAGIRSKIWWHCSFKYLFVRCITHIVFFILAHWSIDWTCMHYRICCTVKFAEFLKWYRSFFYLVCCVTGWCPVPQAAHCHLPQAALRTGLCSLSEQSPLIRIQGLLLFGFGWYAYPQNWFSKPFLFYNFLIGPSYSREL